MNSYADEDTALIITGHSMGGAIAMVLTMMLCEEYLFKKKVTLVTFGQPRVISEGSLTYFD